MVSGLKWRMGFSWGAVLLFGGAIAFAVMANGLLRWLGVIGAIAVGAFIIFQYKQYNTTGWRQVHFRAMIAYARFVGEEEARADKEGRPFSRVNACRELGLAISGTDRAANVEAMVLALEQEKGNYLASLLEANAEKLLPQLSASKVLGLSNILRRFELGPQLVVANIVENSFGSLEAARYAVALLKHEAY